MEMKFRTTDSSLVQYNNTVVEVLGELDESEYDKADVGPMFNIRFQDGKEAEAFEDELYSE